MPHALNVECKCCGVQEFSVSVGVECVYQSKRVRFSRIQAATVRAARVMRISLPGRRGTHPLLREFYKVVFTPRNRIIVFISRAEGRL